MDQKDRTYLETILHADPQERAVAFAQKEYGRGKQMRQALNGAGTYRSGNQNLASLVEEVCSAPQSQDSNALVKVQKTLAPHKSWLRTPYALAKGTLNLGLKAKLHYPLVGLLPAKKQEEIATARGENKDYYFISSVFPEAALGIAASAYLGGVVGGVTFAIAGISAFARGSVLLLSMMANAKTPSLGSALVCGPYYLAKGIKAIYNAVQSSYQDAFKEADKKFLPRPKD